jgi:hypothetical protein
VSIFFPSTGVTETFEEVEETVTGLARSRPRTVVDQSRLLSPAMMPTSLPNLPSSSSSSAARDTDKSSSSSAARKRKKLSSTSSSTAVSIKKTSASKSSADAVVAVVQEVVKKFETRRKTLGFIKKELRLAKSALKRHTKDYEESKMAAAAAATRMQAEENFIAWAESNLLDLEQLAHASADNLLRLLSLYLIGVEYTVPRDGPHPSRAAEEVQVETHQEEVGEQEDGDE